MCAICGCGHADALPGTSHAPATHDHHGLEHSHAPDPRGVPTVVSVEQSLLAENDRFAAYNKGYFDGRGVRCLNLISAPGAGKTTLLEKTLMALMPRARVSGVIEGDQSTDLDARRIATTGARVTQIQTGRACHLDAHQVQHALAALEPLPSGLLFIENVGNLICPSEFDLGEHERVVLLSVTEGADKPAKYPLVFRTATAVVLAKLDLLPHVEFDRAEARRLIAGLNPAAQIFELSARTGQGMDAWLTWLDGRQ